MQEFELYKDIQARTGGDVYIGVVGPVRAGKSTFIRRFMEQLVLPGQSGHDLEMLRDELPVSGAGKTITTVEPKFIPNKAVPVDVGEDITLHVRLVDCVGFVMEGADGYLGDDGAVRMVKTPWDAKEIPFTDAAVIGTEKVIEDHATVGIVVTGDGSFGDFPRESFLEAEKRAITKLQSLGKPFLILVNSERPHSDTARSVEAYLEDAYQAACITLNCAQMRMDDIKNIFEKLLYEFPLVRLEFFVPKWLEMLPNDHWMKQELLEEIHRIMENVHSVKDVRAELLQMEKPFVKRVKLDKVELSKGLAEITIEPDEDYYYGILSEITGLEIEDEYRLISLLKEMAAGRREYENVREAMQSVRRTGYGIVKPAMEEIALDEPELIRQGNKYGVKIRAASPSIHMIRADIDTEIAPIVGNENQARDLIRYINASKEENGIWKTNIFGKSVEQLVTDGIDSKLALIGEESRRKLQDTMKKVVNETSGGLICIII